MARSDYGQIEVELIDNTYILEPTLRALQNINRKIGSIRETVQKVENLDFDALVLVIAEGAGIKQQREREELAEEVFETGVMKVYSPVSEYVKALLNPSGKDPSEEDEGKAKSRSRKESRSTSYSDKEQDG